MLNWRPDSPDQYEDVHTLWQYHHEVTDLSAQERLERLWRCSRDSSRTGVQWNGQPNGGFTTGTPWFAVNENYRDINVQQQETDETSILNYYRRAIALRKSLPVVRDGKYTEYDHENEQRYMYSRVTEDQRLLVVCSFSNDALSFQMPDGFVEEKGKLILGNYDVPQDDLQPWECRVYLWE